MRYIYVIRNEVNGKIYVGQTKDHVSRKKGHWYCARRGESGHLYDSMRKYGLENFSFEVIEECEIDQVDDRERFWISHYDSIDRTKGFNKESGGHGNKTLSEETKQKLSEANKGVAFSEQRCENISKGKLGKPVVKNQGKNNPRRGASIAASLRGKPLSDEHKRSVSETLKRYMAQRGEWHPSDEARKRMSEAQRLARAKRAVLISSEHPDAQPKTCPICGKKYETKTLRPSDVERHRVKRWCSRKCALIAHNKSLLV